MKITVYTKPNCQQCKATYRALTKAGLEYNTVDVTVDPAGRERVEALGYQQLPVVEVAGEGHWSGYRPERVKGLQQTIARTTAAEQQPADDTQSRELQEGVRVVGGVAIPAYEHPDVAAVEKWAAPFVRSARNVGPLPAVGSAAWVALPSNDPRKTGAIVLAALKEVRAVAAIPRRVAQELMETDPEKQASLAVREAMAEQGFKFGRRTTQADLQRIRYGDRAEEVTRMQNEDRSGRVRPTNTRPPAWEAAAGPLTAPDASAKAVAPGPPAGHQTAVSRLPHAREAWKGLTR